ncbi:DSRAD deaminase, partial [Indicator maculatus]|nr:DSRAD deaminase [Indicator maculatus]
TVHDLTRKLQAPKKKVNSTLYKLLREGKLQRAEGTPPLWRISSPSAARERSPSGSGAAPAAEDLAAAAAAGQRSQPEADPMMAETKEKICNYLFSVEESTALNLAKGIGFSRAKDVNAFLSALEKLGDVRKQNTNPPRWALTDHKRERMQLRLKASTLPQAPEAELPLPFAPPCPQEVAAAVTTTTTTTTTTTSSSSSAAAAASPAVTSEEGSLENGQRSVGQSDGSEVDAGLPEDPKGKFSSLSSYDNSEDAKWATDDIPDNLNTIAKQPSESEAIMNCQPCPAYAAHYETAFPCTPVEKLMACQEKNPVSGLTEYSQFTSQHCEFALLEQTGPSHEPRFKFQAVINGRRFPPAEAGSKKLAKQEAAAKAMKILMSEAENGGGHGGVQCEEQPPSTNSEGELVSPLLPSGEAGQGVLSLAVISFTSLLQSLHPEPEASPAAAQLQLLPGKHPISVLMEYGQKSGNSIEFQLLSQEGPPHDPRFSYCVKMGDQIFPAVVGNSKKGAKQMAAEVAVKILSGGSLPEQPFLKPQGDQASHSSGPYITTLDDSKTSKSKGVGDLIKYLNVNPVSGLLEYARSNGFAAEFKLIDQSGPPHDPKFVYQAKVGGRWFPAVTAHSKKQGKQEAADAALRVLIGETEKNERLEGMNITEVKKNFLSLLPQAGLKLTEALLVSFPPLLQLPVSGSTLHDQLAMLSHQCFITLTAGIQHSLLGRKILAAIIMRKANRGLGVVVSVGTG